MRCGCVCFIDIICISGHVERWLLQTAITLDKEQFLLKRILKIAWKCVICGINITRYRDSCLPVYVGTHKRHGFRTKPLVNKSISFHTTNNITFLVSMNLTLSLVGYVCTEQVRTKIASCLLFALLTFLDLREKPSTFLCFPANDQINTYILIMTYLTTWNTFFKQRLPALPHFLMRLSSPHPIFSQVQL